MVIKDSFVSLNFYFMQLSFRNRPTYYYPMMEIWLGHYLEF